MVNLQSELTQRAIAGPVSQRVTAVKSALCAALLGIAILYGVTFAQPQAIHDAAHDIRHASAFPCH